MLLTKTIRYLRGNGISGLAIKVREYLKFKKAAKRYMLEHELSDEELEIQRDRPWNEDVLISLAVPLYNTDREYLAELIDSVQSQTYKNWELLLVDASDKEHDYVGEEIKGIPDKRIIYKKLDKNKGISGNTNEAVAMASGEYIALVDHDDLIAPNCLYEYRLAIDGEADFIYCDEMSFEKDIRKPKVIHIKPDFAIDNLRGNNYICHLSMFKKEFFDEVGGLRSEYDGSQDHDLILRLVEKAQKIVHIRKVLYYWRIHKGSVASDISAKPYCLTNGVKAVKDHIKRIGQKAKVDDAKGAISAYRVEYSVDRMPQVKILNRYNNFYVQKTKAQYVAFADKNVEILSDDWEKEFVGILSRDEVGIVAGKVLSGNKIKSAGVILGGKDGYSYAYSGQSNKSTGYMKRLRYMQDVSAVSCGVVMVRKDVFEMVNGFDEKLYGDEKMIDLSLKIREKGFLVVMDPYVEAKIKKNKKQNKAPSIRFLKRWENEIEKGDEYFTEDLIKYILS